MSLDTEHTAGYAPPQNVLAIFHRLRKGNLPQKLDVDELPRIGVPQATARRTLQTLRLLGLITSDGQHTDALYRLGRASTVEYPEMLAEILKHAYAKVFEVIDPAEATDTELHDAFRVYEPSGQRSRMVTLFIGLCREAELMPPDRTGARAPSPKRPRSTRVKPQAVEASPTTPTVLTAKPDFFSSVFGTPKPTDADYAFLTGFIGQLPKTGRWTMAERDRWVHTFTGMLDWFVKVQDEQD